MMSYAPVTLLRSPSQPSDCGTEELQDLGKRSQGTRRWSCSPDPWLCAWLATGTDYTCGKSDVLTTVSFFFSSLVSHANTVFLREMVLGSVVFCAVCSSHLWNDLEWLIFLLLSCYY